MLFVGKQHKKKMPLTDVDVARRRLSVHLPTDRVDFILCLLGFTILHNKSKVGIVLK